MDLTPLADLQQKMVEMQTSQQSQIGPGQIIHPQGYRMLYMIGNQHTEILGHHMNELSQFAGIEYVERVPEME